MENENKNVRQQLIDRLKESNNVLVTVSRNPSVDQLSAAIGLTLMLNHLGKHGTAVFSGNVPDTLEFLKPEETLEKTTDSLRDFIISLDKAKADKLRYKVEDKMVKIFITPYRTSLSEADLIYEQGDFNVDVVVAIGVHEKEELDEAIISHGRILHDAVVATVNTGSDGQLGSINWVDANASSLSEMLVSVCEAIKPGQLDAQMATAFLTGIVAETDRFSNEKTSSDTMNISAKLMSAGANQQLVATKLEQHAQQDQTQPDMAIQDTEAQSPGGVDSDGSLDISHETQSEQSDSSESDLPEVQPEHESETPQDDDESEKPSRLILEPPSLGSKLTANAEPEALDPSIDPLSPHAATGPLLSHDKDDEPKKTEDVVPAVELEDTPFSMTPPPAEPAPAFEPVAAEEPPVKPEAVEAPVVDEAPAEQASPEPAPPLAPAVETTEPQQEPVVDDQTLSDLEEAVDSPHSEEASVETQQSESSSPDAEAALAAAHQAFDAVDAEQPEKPAAFNASGPMEIAHDEAAPEPASAEPVEPASISIDPATGQLSYPSNLVPPTGLPSDPTAASVEDPTAPPPVPPPMSMPPFTPPSDASSNQQLDPNNLPPVQ